MRGKLAFIVSGIHMGILTFNPLLTLVYPDLNRGEMFPIKPALGDVITLSY